MENNLILMQTGSAANILGYIGDIQNVIAGKLPISFSTQRFHAPDYAYGFEIASVDYPDGMGEAVLLNNYCYTTSTTYGSAHYYQLRIAQDFMTSCFFAIPHDCQPGWIAHYPPQTTALSFPDFYLKLMKEVASPLAFVALVEFENLNSVAIARAPITNQPIFENTSYFYPFPPTQEQGIASVVIGVMTDYANPLFQTVNKQLEKVLYHNPLDNEDFPLTHHAHVLTLNSLPASLLEVNPAMAKSVRHLVIGGSTIRSLYTEIFPIHLLKDLF